MSSFRRRAFSLDNSSTLLWEFSSFLSLMIMSDFRVAILERGLISDDELRRLTGIDCLCKTVGIDLRGSNGRNGVDGWGSLFNPAEVWTFWVVSGWSVPDKRFVFEKSEVRWFNGVLLCLPVYPLVGKEVRLWEGNLKWWCIYEST